MLTTLQPSSVDAVFIEQFQDPISQSRWTVSKATKQTPVGDEIFSYVGTWAVEEPEVFPGIKGDTGLVLSQSPVSSYLVVVNFQTPTYDEERVYTTSTNEETRC